MSAPPHDPLRPHRARHRLDETTSRTWGRPRPAVQALLVALVAVVLVVVVVVAVAT